MSLIDPERRRSIFSRYTDRSFILTIFVIYLEYRLADKGVSAEVLWAFGLTLAPFVVSEKAKDLYAIIASFKFRSIAGAIQAENVEKIEVNQPATEAEKPPH